MWCIIVLLLYTSTSACTPVPLSWDDRPIEQPDVPLSEWYPYIPIDDVPTLIANDVIISNDTTPRLRYGYFVGRPVARFLKPQIVKYVPPAAMKAVLKMPPFLHWAVLVSEEPPISKDGYLADKQTEVTAPATGLILEMRNHMADGKIYLEVQNWQSYKYRTPKVKFLGPLNYTDAQLLFIGRAYVQLIAREGFHTFYRNCQHFTTWYIKALWGADICTATRGDQLLCKLLWWFKDWNETAIWGANKVRGWLGYQVGVLEELDAITEFVGLDVLNRTQNNGSGERSDR